MQEIDTSIDSQPHLALEMIESDILNRQAHEELQAYNDHKIFLYRHPFTRTRKYYSDQFAKLYDLRKKSPDLFLREITNITQNIRRIESNIRKKNTKPPTNSKTGKKTYQKQPQESQF
jgi:hypothetical protein